MKPLSERIKYFPAEQFVDWLCLSCVDVREVRNEEDAQDEINKIRKAVTERLTALEKQRDALAAENVRMKKAIKRIFPEGVANEKGGIGFSDAAKECFASAIETPVTAAYLNSVRAEGIHFAANRILAAWDAGFIDDSPAQVHDITGAVLSALEFLPDASPGEFKRDFADEIRSGIAAQLRAGEPS